MDVRTGLAPSYRNVYGFGSEKNTRGSESRTSGDFTPEESVLAQRKASQAKSVPPVEQTIEGELLDRRRQRQYSEDGAHFRIDSQSTGTRDTTYNSRAVAAYQSNLQLAAPQNQDTSQSIDYFV